MNIVPVKVTLLLAAFFSQWSSLEAVCYFPQQFQGEFMMQAPSSVGSGIQYITVNVTAISIPIWGNCHRRIGSNFILMLNYKETTCVRCLHLKLRSASVLQVFTLNPNIMSQCHTTEELAEADCPSEASLANREAAEILLFKTKDINGLYTRKEYCPIDGKFSVTYKNNNPKKLGQCTGSDSSMDSCPSGSTLNFRLRGCTSEISDPSVECLASWKGPHNQNFLVFLDSRNEPDQKRKYRCALYSHDNRTGEIQMALSRDSTCKTDLINSTRGFETFLLTPKIENPWPAEASFGTCSFPKWMNGNWEYVRVDGDTMIYRDHSSFKSYTIKCVGVQEDEDKYLIYSRTQCDEERYNCMRIIQRSTNILEFQLGSNASSTKDVFVLCSDDNFQEDSWITQGRTEMIETAPGNCPISGEYVGIIPDGDDLCAKLWSDCGTSELMYYEVSHCKTHEIYEEREYRCLGHWSESDYLYTFTQRRDVAAGTYECFVGAKISNKEIYIMEAGEHCQRHINPLHHGMQLNKTSLYTCDYTTTRNPTSIRTSPRTPPDPRRPTSSMLPTVRSTTREWNFDSEGAENKNYKPSSSVIIETTYLLYIIVYIFQIYL